MRGMCPHCDHWAVPQETPPPYCVALTWYALGGTLKVLWLLLAVLLTCLAIGGLMSAAKGADGPSVVGDLVVSALLGAGAVGSWKRIRS